MVSVYVVGAGIVGVSCALNLLEKGYKVTLIDRSSEVKETSFGNAGVIARSSAFLINNRNLIPSLHKYAFNKSLGVRLDYRYLLKNAGWAAQFLYQSLEVNSDKNIRALNRLIKPALAEHKKWLAQAGQLHRLQEGGWLKLFRSPNGLNSTGYEQSIYKQLGIAYQELDEAQIQALEPALNPIYKCGLHIKDTASVDHPGEVTQAYIDLFVARGGERVIDQVSRLSREGEQVVLHGEADLYRADRLVLAAGPWSNDLLKSIAKPLPMCFERGYHQHFAVRSEKRLQRPFLDAEKSFVMTLTSQGYRVTSGSELKDKDAQCSPDQLFDVMPFARQALPFGELVTDSLWQGNRPTLPDSLPAIGPCPQQANIWLAFGHQHVGFSTGPITGRLIAQMIAGERADIDCAPFSPARF
ncbi:NAD(P)/FAD-dependent oxidoreductase [Marinomonas ostreistagni]|uniref:NAD(P)/FAD-dependent oxidoreductase n=1 Tax=Marinomonas ostreistagni TaxID=359209 RepID=UPI0019516ACF|nr:FAD-dependent oxidoreductase [Marinomonas ostreistagni]MBM6550829.1 FAD-binding oxidoreductase [Marinomonas ostreistagni]